MKRTIRQTVRESLNEVGDTAHGQRALGALAQRHALRNPRYDARDNTSKEARIHAYAKDARGGDTYDEKGNNKNPLYKHYAQGSIEYHSAHPDEVMKHRHVNESTLQRIVKESVSKAIREAHVIDKQFGEGGMAGSFESALVNAWRCADNNNRKRLEQAFPDFFPKERMYGNEEEPFDFRDFPNRGAYDKFYHGWKERHSR